jgi:hypothetical protein
MMPEFLALAAVVGLAIAVGPRRARRVAIVSCERASEWVEASVVALHGRLDIVEGKAGGGAAGP